MEMIGNFTNNTTLTTFVFISTGYFINWGNIN